jgi:hypothetical protein
MNTINKQINHKARVGRFGSVLLALAIAPFAPAMAQTAKQEHSSHAAGQEVKAPETGKEHQERAEQYQKKAAEYREEAKRTGRC